jgi:hypothetical protein
MKFPLVLASFIVLLLAACSGGVNAPLGGSEQPTYTATLGPDTLICVGYYGNMQFHVPADSTMNYPQPDNESVDITCGPDGTLVSVVQLHADGQPYTDAEIQALLAAATSTPMPTATPEASACNVYVVTTYDYDVLKNQDEGDSWSWSVTTATNPGGNRFVAIIEPGANLDFEAERIIGQSWKLNGTFDEALCFANDVYANYQGYRLYVGPNEAPADWNTAFAPGWIMKSWNYEEQALESGGTWLDPITVVHDQSDRTYGMENGNGYFQLWNPATGEVVHLIVSAGFELTIPLHFQGTGWFNEGGDWSMFVARSNQATGEVWERDDHPQINKLFCGPDVDNAHAYPSGWNNSLPDGWVCAELN